MKNFFLKDILHLSFVRILAFANVPLQTFIFANYLSSELIQYFFILSGLFSILVIFEGGAGTVLTYEYNRRLQNRIELLKLLYFFKQRFFKLTLYYLFTAIVAFYIYNFIFSGMLDAFQYPYILCVVLMGINFNLYPLICISEGYGKVRQALLIKSIAPILSMLVFLIYVYATGNINAIYIIPGLTAILYLIYIIIYCKHFFVDYFINSKENTKHEISQNVSKANISWSAGYLLTQGFPLLLPFVLSPIDAAKLLLTANLLNAFLSFICIGATVIGPRIPKMIEDNNLVFKSLVIKNLISIYALLVLSLIFFDDLLSIFYLIFESEKFLNRDMLFLFCISFGYVPLYHFSVILLKGIGEEPFVDSNVYVAVATVILVFICATFSLSNFLLIYIWFRLFFVSFIYLYKMLQYSTVLKKHI